MSTQQQPIASPEHGHQQQQPSPPQRKLLRPSQQELSKTMLRPTLNGELAKKDAPLNQSIHVRSSSLQILLKNRSTKEQLVASNVIQSAEGTVQATAQKLLRQKRRDSLQGLLAQRPTIEALKERSYYHSVQEDDEQGGGVETNLASSYIHGHKDFAQDFINVPHRIEGLTDIVQVACGWSHSLALTKDGRVYSWGSTLNGRLGRKIDVVKNVNDDDENDENNKAKSESLSNDDNTKRSPLFPTQQQQQQQHSPKPPELVEFCSQPGLIPNLFNCSKIVCGEHHSAAICPDGLYVWGRNEFGVLGVGTREDIWIPVKVDVQPIITALGLPENAQVEDIALGANHTVIIIYGKALAAGWNKGNRLGLVNLRHFLSYSPHLHIEEQFQDPTVITRFQPIKGLSAPMRAVASSLFIRNVAAGDIMTIAVADIASTQQNNYNNVFLWGTSMHSSPYPIIELNGIEVNQVRMGSNFSILLTNMGEVYCFGSNRDYQLGRAAASDLSSFHAPGPIIIDRKYYDTNTGYPKFISIACGKYHALALDHHGKLYGWGLNKHGILGVNCDTANLPPTPVDVCDILDEHSQKLFPTPEDADKIDFRFVHMDGGASHTLVCDNHGFVYAMGSFRSGKLGL